MSNTDDIINSLSWNTRLFFADFIKTFENKIDVDANDKIFAIDETDYLDMAIFCQNDKRANNFNEILLLSHFVSDELFIVMLCSSVISKFSH